ncbi:hypothetical protein ACFLSA_05135, partial [Bacteroidota bacterium]
HNSFSVFTSKKYGILSGMYNWWNRLKKYVLLAYSEVLIISDLKISAFKTGKNGIKLKVREKQHGNRLNSIKTRQQPVSLFELGHLICTFA